MLEARLLSDWILVTQIFAAWSPECQMPDGLQLEDSLGVASTHHHRLWRGTGFSAPISTAYFRFYLVYIAELH